MSLLCPLCISPGQIMSMDGGSEMRQGIMSAARDEPLQDCADSTRQIGERD